MGELRISVTDASGLPVRGSIELVSEANQYHKTFSADERGHFAVKRLPFGLYHVEVTHVGFTASSNLVEISSAIPKQLKVVLGVAPIESAVTITDNETLIDPHRTGAVNRIGGDTLQNRETAAPGRSLADLVNTQPGWLLEANGVLHPRGSEYQTQYVVDGIPLTDNRSAAFVPDFDVDDVQSMSILTADYPAEYGRKLGGVIEVVTARDTRQGFHGRAIGYGGSFDTAGGYVEGQYGWNHNILSLSADGASTDRYLDPPVLQNFTNHGTTGGLMAHYERDLSDSDRVGIVIRREQAKFLVPNEMVQQAASQRQDRNSEETSTQMSYQHIFSPSVLGDLRGMVRNVSADLWSNPLSTPILADQNRSFLESYVKGTVSAHYGAHELKFGGEGDFGSIREALNYQITDPAQFDPDTPRIFNFGGRAQDREEAAFAQDLMRFHNWTFSTGIRYDHYGLVVQEGAWSPRIGVAWYWPAANMVFRASYDRIFQTPAFENLLIASSPAVNSLSDQVLRLPVRPSRGNFYQAGFAKAFWGKLRLDANIYRRDLNNFADDDLLLNTGVSFPIAFRSAEIHGEEIKLEIPRWGPLSGFISYSNMLAVGYFPVTGGLFLGDDAANAVSSVSGSFPISQDQRNTVSSRFHYQVAPRFWVALAGSYGSGLPVDFSGTYEDAVAQYGQRIVDRVNFSDYRIRPAFDVDASAGVILSKREKRTIRFQADVLNITNQLNVLDFTGLFSGTALAAPRSVSCRLDFSF